jgi:hypothetical protein
MKLVDRYARMYLSQGYVLMEKAVSLPYGWKTDVCRRLLGKDFRAQARSLASEYQTMKLLLAPPILDLARKLGIKRPMMRTAPVCHAMGYDEHFEGTAAHQDYPALQSGLNTMVIWLPAHPVGLGNFPLEIAPKSHQLGLLPAKTGDHYSEVDAELSFLPVHMNAGDVLVFSAFTVHRTRFPGKGHRVAFSWRIEDGDDPWYRERGCYSAQSRVINREVVRVPTVEQVRSVFA